jgi:hypothetical protein
MIMSTLLVVLLVILCISVVLFMIVFLHNRSNRLKTEKLLRCFSELGTEYNLSFTGKEIMRNRIIGVDGLKSKLLFLDHSTADPDYFVIDLTEAKSCRVSKLYGSSYTDNSLERRAEGYLHTIALEFDFMNGGHTVALPLYNHLTDAIQHAPEMEAKAKNWESVLLKMLTKEKKRA